MSDVEVKLTGSAKRKQNKEQENSNKEIDFVLLEERDLTSNRVSLSVEMEPVKSIPSSSSDKSSPSSSDKSDKSSSAADNKKALSLPKMSELKETLLVEPHHSLGLALN